MKTIIPLPHYNEQKKKFSLQRHAKHLHQQVIVKNSLQSLCFDCLWKLHSAWCTRSNSSEVILYPSWWISILLQDLQYLVSNVIVCLLSVEHELLILRIQEKNYKICQMIEFRSSFSNYLYHVRFEIPVIFGNVNNFHNCA